jgi:hypothetical protein
MRRQASRAIVRFVSMTALLAAALPQTAAAARYTLIVAGLGGEPDYEQRFRDNAAAIAAAAEKVAGAPDRVITLHGDRAQRESVRREIKSLAARLVEDDVVTIVLIGHGSFDGEEYRFNLPGPDLTDRELAQLFDLLPARNQLIVNATSASGAVIERWVRPQRVVITATKSGGERTATRFAQYWAQAVGSEAADLNKDDIVTATEAFDFASRQVAAAFKSDVALATEHARLEGDDPARFAVAQLGAGGILSDDPEVAALLSKRGEIERELDLVKESRASLSENEYYDALEGVLVRLASLQRQIDAKQQAQGPS